MKSGILERYAKLGSMLCLFLVALAFLCWNNVANRNLLVERSQAISRRNVKIAHDATYRYGPRQRQGFP